MHKIYDKKKWTNENLNVKIHTGKKKQLCLRMIKDNQMYGKEKKHKEKRTIIMKIEKKNKGGSSSNYALFYCD